MLARLRSPSRIVIVDTSRQRLDFARGNGLGDVFVDPSEEDPVAVVRDMTDGRGADRVMEVAGAEGTFEMAWRMARPNAVVVIVAMYSGPQTLPLPDMYGKNLTFKTGGVDACHCGEIMDLIGSGSIDPSVLITHTFDFEDIMDAYDLFASREDGVMKVAIRMPGRPKEQS